MGPYYVIKVFFFLYVVQDFYVFGANQTHKNDQHMLWCRSCGVYVADLSHSLNIISKGAFKVEHKNILGKNVTVQTLANPFNNIFDVLTTDKASCVDVGRNIRADSWFPGHTWRTCTCPHCDAQLGWTFENVLTNAVEDNDNKMPFHALILSSLLGVTDDSKIAELTSLSSRLTKSSTTPLPKMVPRAQDDVKNIDTTSDDTVLTVSTPAQENDNSKTRLPDRTTTSEDKIGKIVVLVTRPRNVTRNGSGTGTITGTIAIGGTHFISGNVKDRGSL